ncbi:hypothetical protein JOF53_000394 [Crossiella equi]|uniref:Methyltransferase n=1 Tax=Crossiella equi TaxID=130796 RepID=A0ABS5A5J7_9PSEU|nr:methyltransferase [Crossiella equi]MBP2471522.1 hypothetical protein [Crossiella equi]
MTHPSDLPVDRTGMFGMALTFLSSRALYVAAELGLADHVADGPRTTEELARATGTHEPTLYRLLRLLAGVGVFTETAPRTFGTTPLANALRTDLSGSLRPFVLHTLGTQYQAWGELGHTVRTGQEAFSKAMGMPVWQYHAEHPEVNSLLNQVMSRESEAMTEELLTGHDFGPYRTVADIGGGQGALLTGILARHPDSRGILFDQPHVVSHELLDKAGVAERAEVVGGDFFASVPGGADLYVLKWIIHDWPDDKATEILANVRAAMAPGATLALVEYVIPPGNEPAHSKTLDLVMLVLNEGRERTREQFEALLGAAGFRLDRVTAMPSGVSLLEATPV